MVMQMLKAGGMTVLEDARRQPDQHNPRGYLELERMRRIETETDFAYLQESLGKAVKVVSPLLRYLPTTVPCRVVFCQRDLNEAVTSQYRMLGREIEPFEIEDTSQSSAETAQIQERRQDVWAGTAVNCKAVATCRERNWPVLNFHYGSAVADAEAAAAMLDTFVGGYLDQRAMAAAIDPELHRNRRRN